MKHALLFLGLLTAIPSSAQSEATATLKPGTAFSKKIDGEVMAVFGDSEDHFYTIALRRKDVVLQVRGVDLSIEQEAVLQLSDKYKDLKDVLLVQDGDKLALLCDRADEKYDRQAILVTIDPATLAVLGEKRLWGITRDLVEYTEHRGVAHSPDGRTALVWARTGGDGKAPARYSLRVFGTGMGLLSSSDLTMPLPEMDFRVQQFAVANDGVAYVNSCRYGPKGDRPEQAIDEYHVLACPLNAKAVVDNVVDMGGIKAHGLCIDLFRSGTLRCTGVVAHASDARATRIFSCGIDRASLLTGDAEVKDIEEADLGAAENTQLPDDWPYHRMVWREPVPLNDGGVAVAGWESVQIIRADPVAKYIEYYTRDYFAIRVDGGKPAGIVLPNSQHGAYDHGLPPYPLVAPLANGGLALLSNDDPRNITGRSSKLKALELGNASVPVFWSISKGMRAERHILPAGDMAGDENLLLYQAVTFPHGHFVLPSFQGFMVNTMIITSKRLCAFDLE